MQQPDENDSNRRNRIVEEILNQNCRANHLAFLEISQNLQETQEWYGGNHLEKGVKVL